jgi:GNAT superfamily N-acetyltransferase
MKIEISKLKDLTKLAECHKMAFPNSLSSQMGDIFIKKMLSWYIASERGILFHVIENDEIIGYCGGIKTKKAGLPGAATSITQHCFNIFIISFIIRPWLVFHSENIKRLSFIKNNLMYKLGFKKIVLRNAQLLNNQFKTFWGLVVIGVNPKYQGKGAGSILLQEFEKLAKIDGVQKISLTVKNSNLQAIKAYSKNGWVIGINDEESLNMYKEL